MVRALEDGLSFDGDVILSDWKESGLIHPIKVRLGKIATLESELIERELGKLSTKDKQLVSKNFKKLFDFWL